MDKTYTIWIYVFLHPQHLCLAKHKTTKDKDQGQDALPQLKKIEGKIKAAVLGSEEVQGGGEDIFEEPQQGDGEAENKGKSKKILKDVLQKGPPTVQVDLGDKRVSLKTPKAWKESDILVPLDPESLTTVCDFLCEDKGKKKKGGTTRLNFARKSKKGNE